MKRLAISLAHSELEDKPGLATLADQAGFEVIWNSAESIPVFGSMVTATKNAYVGSGVIRAFGHDVRNLAQHTADLQRISGNRFILGLGGGTPYMNVRLFGQKFEHPASRLKELTGLLRQIWTTPAGSRVQAEGRFYQYDGDGMGLPGIKPAPIYFAALNPAMLRITGEVGDGIAGHPVASVPFIENVVWPNIDEGLKKAGRTRDSFDQAVWVITSIDADRDRAIRDLRYEVGRFWATRSFAIVADSQGFESVRKAAQDAFFNHPGDHDRLIDAVPAEVALIHGIAGTPDDVKQQVERYWAVANTVTFYCPPINWDKARNKQNILNMIDVFGKKD